MSEWIVGFLWGITATPFITYFLIGLSYKWEKWTKPKDNFPQ